MARAPITDGADQKISDGQQGRAALALLIAAPLLGVACGDAFSLYAPPQKTRAAMDLFPPERAVDSAQSRVIALIARPDTQSAEILEFSFGQGIVVTEFSTGGGAGCEWTEVEDAFQAYEQSRQTRFPICFELDLRDEAVLGPRTITLDLNMDGAPVISRATFTLRSDDSP